MDRIENKFSYLAWFGRISCVTESMNFEKKKYQRRSSSLSFFVRCYFYDKVVFIISTTARYIIEKSTLLSFLFARYFRRRCRKSTKNVQRKTVSFLFQISNDQNIQSFTRFKWRGAVKVASFTLDWFEFGTLTDSMTFLYAKAAVNILLHSTCGPDDRQELSISIGTYTRERTIA